MNKYYSLQLMKKASQGHWRKLPPTHVGEGRYGEKTFGKTWVDTKWSRRAAMNKKVGYVPSPVRIAAEGDFVLFSVPDGNLAFLVHKDSEKAFIAVTSAKEWVTAKKTRSFFLRLGEKRHLVLLRVTPSKTKQ